jgi:hypothetical protein
MARGLTSLGVCDLAIKDFPDLSLRRREPIGYHSVVDAQAMTMVDRQVFWPECHSGSSRVESKSS